MRRAAARSSLRAAARRLAAPRWRGPTAQATALLVVLSVGLSQAGAARADLAAESGRGPRVDIPVVPSRVAPPVLLGIPDLDLTTRLIGLRRNLDGALQVPEDPSRAGWYSQGPAPGDEGPAVIVGHVDSYRGPGVFARLRTLKQGSLIKVRRSDGTLVVFSVRAVQDYSKRDFPTDVVYRGNGGTSLRLITCGGPFDRRTGHYRENLVVFAAPV